MARPRSEEKQQAIVEAATRVVAEHGVAAPTARIARLAGVAEGTLFTYFATKDELLNHLYLALKLDMREEMMAGYPARGTLRRRAQHVWGGYVRWGVSQPDKRRAMAQLAVSDRITDTTRQAGMQAFAEAAGLVAECVAGGPLRDEPHAYVGALMEALAEATMRFMAQEPARAEHYLETGFEVFWRAATGR